ncbi:MAG: hypothetical protein B6241_02450, partial [Spirochaetaceae bacterium 4572_59]
ESLEIRIFLTSQLTRAVDSTIIKMMFRSKKSNKLSQKEIKTALARIRQKYDDHIITYMTDTQEKSAFEDRYLMSLHARVDLTRFVQEEIIHLKDVEQKAKEEAARTPIKKEISKNSQKSFADKIIDEMEKRTEHYPSLEFNTEASLEVQKLYGALDELYKEYWQSLSEFLRKFHSSELSYNLENRLLRMTIMGADNVPPELERYQFLLSQRGKYSSELFREAQESIKRASFFLHDLMILLQECRERGIIDEKVESAYGYVENIIQDFRLKDLKKG